MLLFTLMFLCGSVASAKHNVTVRADIQAKQNCEHLCFKWRESEFAMWYCNSIHILLPRGILPQKSHVGVDENSYAFLRYSKEENSCFIPFQMERDLLCLAINVSEKDHTNVMESPADVSVKPSDATIICKGMWKEGRESVSSTPFPQWTQYCDWHLEICINHIQNYWTYFIGNYVWYSSTYMLKESQQILTHILYGGARCRVIDWGKMFDC
jgi:hypothetical protein